DEFERAIELAPAGANLYRDAAWLWLAPAHPVTQFASVASTNALQSFGFLALLRMEEQRLDRALDFVAKAVDRGLRPGPLNQDYHFRCLHGRLSFEDLLRRPVPAQEVEWTDQLVDPGPDLDRDE